MDLTAAWRSAFLAWPATLPKAGLVVTAQETVPFVDFLVSDSFVIVERDRPDSQGARKLIIALGAISAVKLTTPEELATLAAFAEKAPESVESHEMPLGLRERAAEATRKAVELGRRPR